MSATSASIAASESASSSARLPPTAAKPLIDWPTRNSWAKRGGMSGSGSGAAPTPTSSGGGSCASACLSRAIRRRPMLVSPNST